jgi:restriction system protein
MWPVLEAIEELGGSARNNQLLEKVIEMQSIPEAVQDVPHTHSRTKLAYHLAWAKSKLGKWGALENPSTGVWTITKKGKTVTKDQIKQISADVVKQYGVENDKEPTLSDEDQDLQPETEKWKEKLLTELVNMDAKAFERLAQRILLAYGFRNVEVTGRSGDGGIDGVGFFQLPDLDLLSFQVHFQCKKYNKEHPVSSSEIVAFRGALVGHDRGLFITTSRFTADATKEATRVAPPIDLVDGDLLCKILKKLKLGVATGEQVSIDSQWFSTI